MTNQPFAIPGQRVRWAVAELRKAGVAADVQRGPDGRYYITVEDDDHDWAAGALAPVMAEHPLLQQKRRHNLLVGLAMLVTIGGGFALLVAAMLTGTAPAIFTGLAVFGLGPVLLVGIGIPVVLAFVVLYMTNLRFPTGAMVAIVAVFLGAIGITTGLWMVIGLALAGVAVLNLVWTTLQRARWRREGQR